MGRLIKDLKLSYSKKEIVIPNQWNSIASKISFEDESIVRKKVFNFIPILASLFLGLIIIGAIIFVSNEPLPKDRTPISPSSHIDAVTMYHIDGVAQTFDINEFYFVDLYIGYNIEELSNSQALASTYIILLDFRAKTKNLPLITLSSPYLSNQTLNLVTSNKTFIEFSDTFYQDGSDNLLNIVWTIENNSGTFDIDLEFYFNAIVSLEA
jgi:hypothetical protein